jgi:hypothetical protein
MSGVPWARMEVQPLAAGMGGRNLELEPDRLCAALLHGMQGFGSTDRPEGMMTSAPLPDRPGAHPMQQASQIYRKLDDPEFLAARARVRDLLETTPEESAGYDGLAQLFADLDAEFILRARCAWSKAMPRRACSQLTPEQPENERTFLPVRQ